MLHVVPSKVKLYLRDYQFEKTFYCVGKHLMDTHLTQKSLHLINNLKDDFHRCCHPLYIHKDGSQPKFIQSKNESIILNPITR